MKKILILAIILFTPFIFSQKQKFDVVFKNVNIVSMENDKAILNQNVAIKDGKIMVIENAKKSKIRGEKTIDLKGKYIMPSLADAHIHLPEREEELQHFLELNLINGVTKLRSMRGNWQHTAWKEKVNTPTSFYPKLYLSPPPITRDQEPNIEKMNAYMQAAKNRNFSFIKVLSIKNQDMFQKLDSLCKIYKMPLGGHFPKLASGNNLNENVFFNSNYTSIEHLGGLFGTKELLTERIKNCKEKNMFICPTLSWYYIGSGKYSLEELPNLTGMQFVKKITLNEWITKTKAYREKLGETAYKEEVASEMKDMDEKYKIINTLKNEGVKMLLSPDASSSYMMTGCNMVTEMELLQNANLTNFEIFQMATANFSDFFKENYGVLKTGKDADFIILDENPLKNLEALKNIKGLYFNTNYLSNEKLTEMKKNLLLSSQN